MKKCFVILCLFMGSYLFASDITVSIGAGNHFKQKRNPQIAVWLESTDGTYIKTLYVTKSAALKKWIFSPKGGRPESLPVWYSASNGNVSEDGFDAVTGATPKGGLVFNTEIDDGKDYVIMAELNNSFDYNDYYTKKTSGVNGQPSVVYSALLPANFSDEIKLNLTGCGSVDGSDGAIQQISHLTTALELVDCIAVIKK